MFDIFSDLLFIHCIRGLTCKLIDYAWYIIYGRRILSWWSSWNTLENKLYTLRGSFWSRKKRISDELFSLFHPKIFSNFSSWQHKKILKWTFYVTEAFLRSRKIQVEVFEMFTLKHFPIFQDARNKKILKWTLYVTEGFLRSRITTRNIHPKAFKP